MKSASKIDLSYDNLRYHSFYSEDSRTLVLNDYDGDLSQNTLRLRTFTYVFSFLRGYLKYMKSSYRSNYHLIIVFVFFEKYIQYLKKKPHKVFSHKLYINRDEKINFCP